MGREKIVGPYFLRAAALWEKIERWCDDPRRSGTAGGAIKASLLPGRIFDLRAFGDRRQHHAAFQAVYAFYAGQRQLPAEADVHHHAGLFGGVQVYDFLTSTRWLAPRFPYGPGRVRHVMLAHGTAKSFVMKIETGQVYYRQSGHEEVATPNVVGASHFGNSSVLRWFEEHARRLHRDFYSTGTLASGDGLEYDALLNYPEISDATHCSRAVTRGVEVVASAVLCLEIKMFVYSIRMRLLSPADGEGYATPEERGFDTCQLVSRHWRISKSSPDSDETVVEQVRGDGVIGYYPILHEGRYESHYGQDPDSTQLEGQGTGYFSYQSCTQPVPGALEGRLQFVPGSLAAPCGERFDVRVNPFPLKFPDYLY